MLWIILTFLMGLGAIIIAGIEVANNQPVNPIVYGIITSVAAHAFTIGGSVNTSSQLEKNTTNAIASANQTA